MTICLILTIHFMFPFKYRPENNGREEGRKGIYLTFDGAVPKRIGKSIGQGTYYAGGHDADHLVAGRRDRGSIEDDLPCKMGDGPEKKQDGEAAGNCAHEVYASCRAFRVVAKA